MSVLKAQPRQRIFNIYIYLYESDQSVIIGSKGVLSVKYYHIFHKAGGYRISKLWQFCHNITAISPGSVLLCIPYTAVYNPQEYTTRTPTFDPKILKKNGFRIY